MKGLVTQTASARQYAQFGRQYNQDYWTWLHNSASELACFPLIITDIS